MNEKSPDIVYVRKQDIEDFRAVVQEKDSPFYKRYNKDVFMMAMALGFQYHERLPLDNREGFFRVEYLSQDEKSMIKALAIDAVDDLNILLDKQKVYSIAEEYASGGIKYLKEAVFETRFGSYIKKLESDLVEEFEKLQLST